MVHVFWGLLSNSHEPVIKKGEELLKKNASVVNLDDQNLINKLFLLFNGAYGKVYLYYVSL